MEDLPMLVLSRRIGESIIGTISAQNLHTLLTKAEKSGEPIRFKICLLKAIGPRASLGFECPHEIDLAREEIATQVA